MTEFRRVADAMETEARKLSADTGLGRLAMAAQIAYWSEDVRRFGLELDLERKEKELAGRALAETREKLAQIREFVTAYECCPASHRPDKATIIEKLKEMLDGK